MKIETITLLIFTTLAAFPVSGQIYIDGTVSGDLAPASYIIKKGITIPPEGELIIAAGAELRFSDSAYINVYGRLVTAGTSTFPVNFTSQGSGRWKGIRIFNGKKGISLTGTIISQCDQAIYLGAPVDTLTLQLQRCMVRNCSVFIANALGNRLLEPQSKSVSGECIYPDGPCSLLKKYEPVATQFMHSHDSNTEKEKQLILRRPTLIEKIIVSTAAAVIVVFSIIISQEHTGWY